MRRWTSAVNGRARRVAAACLIALVLPSLVGCREQRADRLYREAARRVERGDLAGAVEKYDRLIAEFPGSRAAARAKSDVVLYRGLLEASRRFPVRRAGDLLVQVARALERFRAATGRSPSSLSEIVPAYLASTPVDPWGRPLEYRAKADGGYTLRCRGADGAEGGERENTDLEVEDGRFVKGNPEAIP
ncbi:MAG: type II secretion system protein GspG [Acidobacteriia bacterium]|nr:type II secretion system protein GspG [Terriglobia bacterium]